jgi:hypothetical protein
MTSLFDVQDYFNLIPTESANKRGNPNWLRKYSDKTKPVRIPLYLVDKVKSFINNIENNTQDKQEKLIIEQKRLNSVTQIKTDDYKIAIIDPHEIAIDAKRFQFKQIHSYETGASGSLRGIKTWDPIFAGLIQVWLDPKDNKTYVVNGHNRLNLALQLGIKKIAIQFLNCETPLQARIKGALHNMLDSKGTLFDAAKLLKEANLKGEDLRNFGIKVNDSFISKAMALSNLENWLFDKAISGELDQKYAIAIGELDKKDQKTMYELVKSYKGILTEKALLELKKQVELAGYEDNSSLDMFGNKEDILNLAVQRSKVVNWIETQLRRSAKIYGLVSNTKNQDILEEVVENIDTIASSLKKEQAKQILDLFLLEKNYQGKISQEINKCVNSELEGKNINQTRNNLLNWLVIYLATQYNFLDKIIA